MFGFNWLSKFWTRRSGLSAPAQWLVRLISGDPTAAGVSVTAESATRVATVFACIKVLSETVGSLPLHVYRRTANGGKEIDRDHPLYSVLHDQPNRWHTSMEFRELMMGHLLLRGNAFAEIVPGPKGAVTELVPKRPDRIEIEPLTDGSLRYVHTDPFTQVQTTYSQDQILHIRGLGSDGIAGLSPIEQAREAIGLAIVTEKHGARVFGNGARFPGFHLRNRSAGSGSACSGRRVSRWGDSRRRPGTRHPRAGYGGGNGRWMPLSGRRRGRARPRWLSGPPR